MSVLLKLNPSLDREALAEELSRSGILQVRDFLTPESAAAVQRILVNDTPWGLAVQAGASAAPRLIRAEELHASKAGEHEALVSSAAADADYGFVYHSYPLVTAYLERWRPGSAQEQLLEELNAAEVLEFLRLVSGEPGIAKMDGQATLYGPGHFLRPHNDEESERGRRVAYVLNLTAADWQPHWGGYLNFFDADWNVRKAFRPRFNALNLFRVPQWHSVGEVAASAPLARYAITGWARDR